MDIPGKLDARICTNGSSTLTERDDELDDKGGNYSSTTQVLAELFCMPGQLDYTFDKLTEIRLWDGSSTGLVYRHFDYPYDDVSSSIFMQGCR